MTRLQAPWSRSASAPSSRFSTTDVTVGLKDVGLLPGGSILTLSFCPGTSAPEMEVMKGSQEACPGRSVRTPQTRSGLALISTVELTVFMARSFHTVRQYGDRLCWARHRRGVNVGSPS